MITEQPTDELVLPKWREELEQLQRESGKEWEGLAAELVVSAKSLYNVRQPTGSGDLPRWSTVRPLVAACGGNEELWLDYWKPADKWLRLRTDPPARVGIWPYRVVGHGKWLTLIDLSGSHRAFVDGRQPRCKHAGGSSPAVRSAR
jgi:hypothetical protein